MKTLLQMIGAALLILLGACIVDPFTFESDFDFTYEED